MLKRSSVVFLSSVRLGGRPAVRCVEVFFFCYKRSIEGKKEHQKTGFALPANVSSSSSRASSLSSLSLSRQYLISVCFVCCWLVGWLPALTPPFLLLIISRWCLCESRCRSRGPWLKFGFFARVGSVCGREFVAPYSFKLFPSKKGSAAPEGIVSSSRDRPGSFFQLELDSPASTF